MNQQFHGSGSASLKCSLLLPHGDKMATTAPSTTSAPNDIEKKEETRVSPLLSLSYQREKSFQEIPEDFATGPIAWSWTT